MTELERLVQAINTITLERTADEWRARIPWLQRQRRYWEKRDAELAAWNIPSIDRNIAEARRAIELLEQTGAPTLGNLPPDVQQPFIDRPTTRDE